MITSGRRRSKRRLVLLMVVPTVAAATLAFSFVTASAAGRTGTAGQAPTSGTYSLLSAADTSEAVLDPDNTDVELGVAFTTSAGGTLDAIRFLKATGDIDHRTVTLWSATGTKLASQATQTETASGWQTVALSTPATLQPRTKYIVSYHAKRYMVTEGFFKKSLQAGPLEARRGFNGVYTYGDGFPVKSYHSSNYWIDVVVTVNGGTGAPVVSPSPTSVTPVPPTTTVPAPPTSTIAPTTPPVTTNPPTSPPASGGGGQSLSLPRVAWEGGSSYYSKFATAKAAGWSDPSFFPIAIWYDGISNDAEVKFDKAHGINTYTGQSLDTDYNLYARNNVYTLDKLKNEPANAINRPGTFLDDEPDGRFSDSAKELSYVKNLVAQKSDPSRFQMFNWSGSLLFGTDPAKNKANFEAMYNSYDGPASMDKYFYVLPDCNLNLQYMIEPIDPAHCRTSSSYGAMVRAMRTRDASDGKLKPVWQFIENVGGSYEYKRYIQPGELKGAVMNSIINEARGIIYFNQSFAGPCQGGNMIRQVQTGESPCAKPSIDAMGQVNNQVKALAPIINTQSYKWTFGTNLNTMLKTYSGSAYVFSMISGDASSQPGSRTFTLPPDLAKATSVSVVDENRSIPVSGGKFTDTFAQEFSYHIYKVTM